MIKTTNIQSVPSNGFLVGDFLSLDNFIAVRNDGQLMNAEGVIQHDISWNLVRPQITLLYDHTFILSEMDLSHFPNEHPNAWVVSSNGEVLDQFYIGQANRLISTDKYIIATYDPASYYRGKTAEFEVGGLAVFNHKGELQYHLDVVLDKQFNFFEIKSIASFDNDGIYFQTYPNFDILKFDLNHFLLSIEHQFPKNRDDIADEFWIPDALSRYGDHWIFLTSSRETQESTIFAMDSNSKIEEIGKCNYAYATKGLSNGRFFVPSFNHGNFENLDCQLVTCTYEI
ncbi:MAG: hypothetical protein P1U56_22520 [Saprospiraceae bacterium]|nr:hypothetical protein [Saprospiraceae bacterium]